MQSYLQVYLLRWTAAAAAGAVSGRRPPRGRRPVRPARLQADTGAGKLTTGRHLLTAD